MVGMKDFWLTHSDDFSNVLGLALEPFSRRKIMKLNI